MIKLLIITMFIVSSAAAQIGISLRLGCTYNTYDLSGLSKLQQSMISSVHSTYGVAMKPVDEFPAWFGIQGQTAIYFNGKTGSEFAVGLSIGYISTGGRLAYQDYSGEIRFDQLIHCWNIGALVEKELFALNKKKFALLLLLKILFVATEMDLNNYMRLGDQYGFSSLKLETSSMGLEPGVSIRLNLFKACFLRINFGYLFYVPTSLTLKGNRYATLLANDGQAVNPNWSGLRIETLFELKLGTNPEPTYVRKESSEEY